MTITQTKTPAVPSSDTKAPDDTKLAMITLEELAREMKISQRDARMLLRLAAKQTKQFPNLATDHVARQPWQWAKGSKAFDEARKALLNLETN